MTLVFGCALRRVHSPGSGLGEIKDEETGENLLEDKVRLALCQNQRPRVYLSVSRLSLSAAGYASQIVRSVTVT